MTDVFVLASVAPLMFLAFGWTRKFTRVWMGLSILLALVCNAYFIYLRASEPLLWIAVGAFLSLFALDLAAHRKARGLSTLGALFLAQALLARSLGDILVLVAMADAFFAGEIFFATKGDEKSRAVQSIYQSALSLLPAGAALLLRLEGEWLLGLVAATAVIRLFSWPVTHLVGEINKTNRLFFVYAGAASTFAFWHILTPASPELWALVWMCLALFFSAGAKYHEMYGALTLGAYCVAPVWGLAAVSLWPLLARQSFTTYAVSVSAGFLGVLIADAGPKVLMPEVAIGLAAVGGLAAGRVFSSVPLSKEKWYWLMADVALSGTWIGLLTYFIPLPMVTPGPAGLAFACGFVAMYVAGLIFARKSPWFFSPARALSSRVFSRDFSPGFLAEKRGGEVCMPVTRARVWLAEAIESEAYFVLLAGALGAALIWGLK